MYFYVAKEDMEEEKSQPYSTDRKPCSEPGIFLWGQAMFILAQLLTAGLLHINELDPIRRYLPSYNRPRKAGRYSAFQVILFQTKLVISKNKTKNLFSLHHIEQRYQRWHELISSKHIL